MVHLRGELDPVTGAKVRKRFLLEVERLRRLDLHSAGGEKRSLNQRMADALDTLTSHGSIHSNATSAPPTGHGRGGTGAITNASTVMSESDVGNGGGSRAGGGVGVMSESDVGDGWWEPGRQGRLRKWQEVRVCEPAVG